MRPLSFRARLTLFHTGAFACFLGLVAMGGHWALSRLVLGQLDAALLALAETEAVALQARDDDPIRVHEFAPGTAPPQFVRLDRFVQITGLNGAVLARSANLGTAQLPLPAPMREALNRDEIVFETFDHFGDEPIRLAAISIRAGGHGYRVLVAGSLDDAHAILAAARWLFAGLSVVLLAAVAFASAFFARRALRPIDQIVIQARSIGEPNLRERLPHPRTEDELGRLVDTLNAMLERIERGVTTQRRFTADASHELRSPLSRLRAELEITLRRPRDVAEYKEVLHSCLEEVKGLSQLTEELLTLAHLDSERTRDGPPVALEPIVDDAVQRARAEADRRAVRFRVEPSSPPSLVVTASPMAVRLALTNVLDNALKFSPVGGEVCVDVSQDGSDALIVVSDEGPGVTNEELPGVFDRFHRGAAARAGDAPGFGLGLAISKAALERHGGRISAESGPSGGARFSIRLPLAS
jgi:two-component system, OmpR family, sensor kinase